MKKILLISLLSIFILSCKKESSSCHTCLTDAVTGSGSNLSSYQVKDTTMCSVSDAYIDTYIAHNTNGIYLETTCK